MASAKYEFKEGTKAKRISNLKYKKGVSTIIYNGPLQSAPDEALDALIAEGSNLVSVKTTAPAKPPKQD